MKLKDIELILAFDEKNWEALFRMVLNYFGLSGESFRDYRVTIERWADAPYRNRIIIYHKKSGYFCWDQHEGWSADGPWKFGRAGTIVIRLAHET